jgi:hypothetical protein
MEYVGNPLGAAEDVFPAIWEYASELQKSVTDTRNKDNFNYGLFQKIAVNAAQFYPIEPAGFCCLP